MAMNIAIYEGKGEGEIGLMNRLEVNGELVVPTAQLAKLYNCSSNTIVKTFHRHKEQFVEGVHYFKLVGEDLRNFKREMTDCHSVTNCPSAIVNPNATVFYLWTAVGAAKFAKSLKSRRAWDIYEQLAVNYFKTLPNKKSAKTSAKNEMTNKEKVDRLIRLAKITKDATRRENLIAIAEKIIVG